jgi:hypothetical protein
VSRPFRKKHAPAGEATDPPIRSIAPIRPCAKIVALLIFDPKLVIQSRSAIFAISGRRELTETVTHARGQVIPTASSAARCLSSEPIDLVTLTSTSSIPSFSPLYNSTSSLSPPRSLRPLLSLNNPPPTSSPSTTPLSPPLPLSSLLPYSPPLPSIITPNPLHSPYLNSPLPQPHLPPFILLSLQKHPFHPPPPNYTLFFTQ